LSKISKFFSSFKVGITIETFFTSILIFVFFLFIYDFDNSSNIQRRRNNQRILKKSKGN
jgi:hypothetical protein